MRFKRLHWAWPLLLILVSCSLPAEERQSAVSEVASEYLFEQPDKVTILPDSLMEVSDLCWVGEDTLLAVQDELGILFYLDANSGQILRKEPFGPPGDYEGVASSGDTIFVLRSDGVVFEKTGDSVRSYDTGVPAKNNEGFCYDAQQHQLLIGPTSRAGKQPLLSAAKDIYAFDLKTHRLKETPAFSFDLDLLHDFAAAHDVDLPEHKAKKRNHSFSEIRFSISGIALHPLTGEIWLISVKDQMLFVFDRQSRIRQLQYLPEESFVKPEGISFATNGDLFISNEGRKGKPTVMRFRIQRE